MAWPGPVYFPEMLWDEAEHPRHPRGTSRGGQFREKRAGPPSLSPISGTSERWVQTAMHGMGLDLEEDELRDVINRGREVARSPLAGGSIGATSLVTFEMPDGDLIALVHKQQDPDYSDLEVWSSRIGRAIGAPVLTVIHDPGDEDSVYMPYVDGQSALQRVAAILSDEDLPGSAEYDVFDDLNREHAGTRRGALLGLLDIALLNADRHGGNWVIDQENQAWGIDHTHIRPWDDDDYGDQGYEDFGMAVYQGESPLTADDIEAAIGQIERLVGRNQIPDEWWPTMQARLQRLKRTYQQPAYSFPGGAY